MRHSTPILRLKTKHRLFFILFLSTFFSMQNGFAAEENFLFLDGSSNESIIEMGPSIDERITPCSTFKIALSLMGFDSGILEDEKTPVWLFQEGYDDFLDAWKNPQTPHTWMQNSCVWFSKIIAAELGLEKFQSYLTALGYGNQEAHGESSTVWINSSIKISPREQVQFIQRMLQKMLPVSNHAVEMTKKILFIEELSNGWSLFGKSGWGGSTTKLDDKGEIGWFVGWIEKDNTFLPFAYNIRADKIDLSNRKPRVKELINKTGISNN